MLGRIGRSRPRSKANAYRASLSSFYPITKLEQKENDRKKNRETNKRRGSDKHTDK